MSDPSPGVLAGTGAATPAAPARWDPLAHPLLFARPERVELPLGWAGHIPFAMLLVDLLRPRVLVELGTHSGNSYNAFCQAVDALGLATRCFAVDTWEGDPHAGDYGPEVYASLRAHQASRYSRFSTLLKTTFDEALAHFAPGSIDLLHIDGLHTYAAVRHDFETWRPRLSERAVVLFHDTAVVQADFGVGRFWRELQLGYPSLEFPHCNGLGLLAVGRALPEGVRALIDREGPERPGLLALAERLGDAIVAERQLQEREKDVARLGGSIGNSEPARQTALADLERAHQERDRAIGQLRSVSGRLDDSQSRLRELEAQADQHAAERLRLAQEAESAHRVASATRSALAETLASRSWRLTAPLRLVCGLVRRVLRRAMRAGRKF